MDRIGGMLTGWARFEADKLKKGKLNPDELAGKVIVENEQLRGGFVQLPRFILTDKKLSSNAKICYGALLHYAWQKDNCYPSIEDFCELLGLARSTVMIGLKDLKESGYIEIKRWGQGRNNTYFLPQKPTKKA